MRGPTDQPVTEESRLHNGMEWRHMTPEEAALFPRSPLVSDGSGYRWFRATDHEITIVLNRLPGEKAWWARAGLTRERYAAVFGAITLHSDRSTEG
jgi:hypothetical protein